MTNEQSIIRSKKLELFQWQPVFCPRCWWCYNKGHIVTWIRVHDFMSTNRPVNPLDLVSRMLYHDSCRLRCLTISHVLLLGCFDPKQTSKKWTIYVYMYSLECRRLLARGQLGLYRRIFNRADACSRSRCTARIQQRCDKEIHWKSRGKKILKETTKQQLCRISWSQSTTTSLRYLASWSAQNNVPSSRPLIMSCRVTHTVIACVRLRSEFLGVGGERRRRRGLGRWGEGVGRFIVWLNKAEKVRRLS